MRSGNSAVSGVRSSVVCARGCWEVALCGAPDVKFALYTVAGMVPYTASHRNTSRTIIMTI